MATSDSTEPNPPEAYGAEWPIIWRLVCPGAGSYDHDMVFCETTSKDEAIKQFRSLRRDGCPCRVERVHCGPLPRDFQDELQKLRSYNDQNPGTSLRRIPGAWSKVRAA